MALGLLALGLVLAMYISYCLCRFHLRLVVNAKPVSSGIWAYVVVFIYAGMNTNVIYKYTNKQFYMEMSMCVCICMGLFCCVFFFLFLRREGGVSTYATT